MVKKSPTTNLPDISDEDLLDAYKERERQQRKQLSLVQKLAQHWEELKIEAKAAHDLLVKAQQDLNIITGKPVQTALFTAPAQEPEDLHPSDSQ
jgi:hypothetical protein